MFVRTTRRRHAERRPGAVDRAPRLRGHRGHEARPTSPSSTPTGQVLSAVGHGRDGRRARRPADQRVRGAGARRRAGAARPRRRRRATSAVTVTAELDYDETQRTTEEFSATDGHPAAGVVDDDRGVHRRRRRRRRACSAPTTSRCPNGGDGTGTYSVDHRGRHQRGEQDHRGHDRGAGRASSASRSPSRSTPAAAAGSTWPNLQAMVAAAAGIDTDARRHARRAGAWRSTRRGRRPPQDALAAADAAGRRPRRSNVAHPAGARSAGAVLLARRSSIVVLARRVRPRRGATTLDLGELALGPRPARPARARGRRRRRAAGAAGRAAADRARPGGAQARGDRGARRRAARRGRRPAARLARRLRASTGRGR